MGKDHSADFEACKHEGFIMKRETDLSKYETHLFTLLIELTKQMPEQTRFVTQGTRYLDGGAKLCQWYLDTETNKLYSLILSETSIDEALPRVKRKEDTNES